ncbi:FAD/NAD(P)-binding domain-containing protein [Auricularia subglabra TFB-10046 SS5]|nr:FAD/NAD(P)-binding domain-containing protein [Auricularia subglabra TFB-10046 SS5]
MTAKNIANRMPSGYRVVVIEKNDTYQHLFNFPRYTALPAHPSHLPRAFVPFTGIAKSCPPGSLEWITDRVVNAFSAKDAAGPDAARGYVELADGTFVPYRYLIIATGADTSRLQATTKEAGFAELRARSDAVAAAKSILIIGGGAVGVELATDIKTQYLDAKSVTLVHSRDRLMDRFGVQLHAAAMRRCKAVGVRVILGERPEGGVDGQPGTITLPKTGEEISYDLLFKCIGGGSHEMTKPFRSLLPASSFNARDGRLRTSAAMQIVDAPHDGIFALGDVSDPDVPDVVKMARATFYQGKVVSQNVVRLIEHEGKSGQPSLRSYKPMAGEDTIKLTLGLWDACVWMHFGKLEWAPMSKLKSLDLDAKFVWRHFGVADQYPEIEEEAV